MAIHIAILINEENNQLLQKCVINWSIFKIKVPLVLPTSINGNLQSTYIFAVAIALVLQWRFQVLLDSVIYLLTIKLETFKKFRFVYNILEVVITFIDNTYHYYYAKERPTYFNGQLGSSWFNRFFFQ